MDKKNKIYIFGIIAVVVIAAIISVVILLRKPATTNNSNTGTNTQNNSTSYVSLPPGEEEQIKQFVKLFVDLYNSYGYEDFKSAYNEATYGTPDFQQKTIDKFNDLEANTKEGYSQLTKTDINSFNVVTYKNNGLVVNINGEVNETYNNQTSNYPIIATVSFTNINGQWIVTDCLIQKK